MERRKFTREFKRAVETASAVPPAHNWTEDYYA